MLRRLQRLRKPYLPMSRSRLKFLTQLNCGTFSPRTPETRYDRCKDIENNYDYKICTTEESVKLGNCHLGCDYELDCVRNCTLTFYENIEYCPCKVSFPRLVLVLVNLLSLLGHRHLVKVRFQIFSQNVLADVHAITTLATIIQHHLLSQRPLLQ